MVEKQVCQRPKPNSAWWRCFKSGQRNPPVAVCRAQGVLELLANIAQFPKLKSERISHDRLGLPPKDVDFWAVKLRGLVSGGLISEEC